MRILVLDDQWQDIAATFNAKAAKLGHLLAYVATIQEAEKVLGECKFDLLLLDGNLGRGPTGPEVIYNWKCRELAFPPIVMISSDTKLNDWGIKEGAIGGLTKSELAINFGALQKFRED